MSTEFNFHEYAPRPLCTTVVASYMPPQEVSERTNTARRIGAEIILNHLLDGEWGTLDNRDKAMLGNFLYRIIANAKRHGVEVAQPNKDADTPHK